MMEDYLSSVKKAVYSVQLVLLDGLAHPQHLRVASSILTQAEYEDVARERSIAGHCGFPLCPHVLLPSDPSGRKGRYRISLSEKKVYDLQESRLFCSADCLVRSRTFASSLLPERDPLSDGVGGRKLLESVDRFHGLLCGAPDGREGEGEGEGEGDGDGDGDGEERGKSGKKGEEKGEGEKGLVIKEKKEEATASSFDHVGPADAVEGYVPKRAAKNINQKTVRDGSVVSCKEVVQTVEHRPEYPVRVASGTVRSSNSVEKTEDSVVSHKEVEQMVEHGLEYPIRVMAGTTRSGKNAETLEDGVASHKEAEQMAGRCPEYPIAVSDGTAHSGNSADILENCMVSHKEVEQIVEDCLEYPITVMPGISCSGSSAENPEDCVVSHKKVEQMAEHYPAEYPTRVMAGRARSGKSGGMPEDGMVSHKVEQMLEHCPEYPVQVSAGIIRSVKNGETLKNGVVSNKEMEQAAEHCPEDSFRVSAESLETEIVMPEDGTVSHKEVEHCPEGSIRVLSEIADSGNNGVMLEDGTVSHKEVEQMAENCSEHSIRVLVEIPKEEEEEEVEILPEEKSNHWLAKLKSALKRKESEKSLNRVSWADHRPKEGALNSPQVASSTSSELSATKGGDWDTGTSSKDSSNSVHVREGASPNQIEDVQNVRLKEAEAIAKALEEASMAVASGEIEANEAAARVGISILPPEEYESIAKLPLNEAASMEVLLEQSKSKALKPGIEDDDDDLFDAKANWFSAPPKGFKAELSTFGTIFSALDEWISAASVAYIYGKDASEEDQFTCVNGREYPRQIKSGDGTAAEIERTMSSCISRALPHVVEILRLSIPMSTLEQALGRLLRTMNFIEAIPSFNTKQWALLVSLFLYALSIERLTQLQGQLANNRMLLRKVIDLSNANEAEFEALKDTLLPLGRLPEFATRCGG